MTTETSQDVRERMYRVGIAIQALKEAPPFEGVSPETLLQVLDQIWGKDKGKVDVPPSVATDILDLILFPLKWMDLGTSEDIREEMRLLGKANALIAHALRVIRPKSYDTLKQAHEAIESRTIEPALLYGVSIAKHALQIREDRRAQNREFATQALLEDAESGGLTREKITELFAEHAERAKREAFTSPGPQVQPITFAEMIMRWQDLEQVLPSEEEAQKLGYERALALLGVRYMAGTTRGGPAVTAMDMDTALRHGQLDAKYIKMARVAERALVLRRESRAKTP